MKIRKAGAIGINAVNRAVSPSAAARRSTVKSIAGQNQRGLRPSSVRVGVIGILEGGEIIEVCETRPIGIDGEDSAASQSATLGGRPIQPVAGQ